MICIPAHKTMFPNREEETTDPGHHQPTAPRNVLLPLLEGGQPADYHHAQNQRDQHKSACAGLWQGFPGQRLVVSLNDGQRIGQIRAQVRQVLSRGHPPQDYAGAEDGHHSHAQSRLSPRHQAASQEDHTGSHHEENRSLGQRAKRGQRGKHQHREGQPAPGFDHAKQPPAKEAGVHNQVGPRFQVGRHKHEDAHQRAPPRGPLAPCHQAKPCRDREAEHCVRYQACPGGLRREVEKGKIPQRPVGKH